MKVPDSVREGLVSKYRAMVRLRGADDGEPKAALRALAGRWPGALREIDELSDAEIARRIAVLERGGEESWIAPLARFHGTMRAALRIKRRFGRAADPAEVADWLRTLAPRDLDEPSDEALIGSLATILRPPEGRLGRWIWEEIANSRGTDRVNLERVIFGRARTSVGHPPDDA